MGRIGTARFLIVVLPVVLFLSLMVPHLQHSHREEDQHPSRSGLVDADLSGQHPVRKLIEEAERRWAAMNERQSQTLEDAVNEYQRRNGYLPPRGFDFWWRFVQKHNVKLVDEFDQINYDIRPFLALSPTTFRARRDSLPSDTANTFYINITDGKLRTGGPMWSSGDWGKSHSLANMMLSFSAGLPDLTMHILGVDYGRYSIGNDLRNLAEKIIKENTTISEEAIRLLEDISRDGSRADATNACVDNDSIFSVTHSNTTFISDPLRATSICDNPKLQSSFPFIFTPSPNPISLSPLFVHSKRRSDSGILLPQPVRGYYDLATLPAASWSERAGTEKLFWRGLTTGWSWFSWQGFGEARGMTWRSGGRPKFVVDFGNTTARKDEQVDVLAARTRGGNVEVKRYERGKLNKRWMDVGFTGQPIGCNMQDGTCAEMRETDMWREPGKSYRLGMHKYMLDLDSYGWSEDFHRLLGFGSVVLKATIYPEWNTQWLIPWYHYIPIQTDYSDVYNVMSFFLGDPDNGENGNDEIAEKIGGQATHFVKNYWRWEDMQAYLLRLLLEYARLGEDDRDAASFRLPPHT